MSIYFVIALSFINSTSVFASRVILTLYALALGAQPITIGLLSTAFSVFPMLLAVTAGRLSDRFGPRWLLIFGAAGSGLGMMLPYFVHGLPAIFIAGAMSGFSLIFFSVSTQNLVGLLSTPQNRATNFSNYSLGNSAADFLGPLIAGFSIEHSSHASACLYVALLTLVPVAMFARRGADLPGGSPAASKSKGNLRAMLAAPEVRRTLVTGSLLQAGTNLYRFYLPVYAHSIGLSASIIGMVLAMNSAAAFVVRTVLARLIAKYKEERLLAYAFFLGAASLALIPFFKGAVLLGLMSFVFGLGMGCGQPIVTMLMFSSSADGRSGEALGLKMTVNQLTKLISPVVFGAIASGFGLSPMFWLNSCMLVGGGLMSRPRKKN